MLKKSFTAFVVLVSLISCKKEVEKTTGEKIVNDSISKIKLQVESFKPIDTACYSKNKTEDYIATLQWYQKKTKKEVTENSPEQNDRLYEDYIKIRNKYTACVSENLAKVLEEYVNYYSSESDQLQLPENVKKLTEDLKKGDLIFMEVGEGYTEIWSAPDHYFSIFKNKVTPDYHQYIYQLSRESEGLYAADAGLVISWKELGERSIFWENFIRKYPQSKLLPKAKEMYSNYLCDYLFGLDNTPTHEHSDGTIYAENRDEFNRMIKKYPNSNVAKKSKELMSLFDAKVPEDEIHKRINIDNILNNF